MEETGNECTGIAQMGYNWEQATDECCLVCTRYGHTSLVYDNKMWVLGGFDGDSMIKMMSGIVQMGLIGSKQQTSAAWSARYDHTSLVYDNKMWVIGGEHSSNKNDVWYSTDGINWEQATDDVLIGLLAMVIPL